MLPRGCRRRESSCADHEGPYRILGQIVVRTQDSIFHVAGQPIPLTQRITNRLTQKSLWRGLVIQRVELLLDLLRMG